MPTLRLPTPLRPYANGQSEIQLQAETVGQALDQLVQRFPEIKKHVFSDQGELRPFVNLFLDQEDVRYLQGVDTPLQPDDRLMIIPSIAGGSPA